MAERTQVFPLPPVGKLALLVPVLIGGVLPVVALTLVVATAPPGEAWPAFLAVAVLPVVGLLIALDLRHRRIELLGGGLLRVRRWPVPKQVHVSEFDLAAARVVDLDAEPGLRPRLKVAGTHLPGFSSGWFKLRDRSRAYVLFTERRRALLLPRRDGAPWLLGAERPDALLAALRAAR